MITSNASHLACRPKKKEGKKKRKASCLIVLEVDLSKIKGALVPQGQEPIWWNQWNLGTPASFLLSNPSFKHALDAKALEKMNVI